MRLMMSDGTVLEGASLITAENRLFLYIPGGEMRQVFDLMMNRGATATIIYEDGPVRTVHQGYQKLTSIGDEGTGQITAVLRKEGP